MSLGEWFPTFFFLTVDPLILSVIQNFESRGPPYLLWTTKGSMDPRLGTTALGDTNPSEGNSLTKATSRLRSHLCIFGPNFECFSFRIFFKNSFRIKILNGWNKEKLVYLLLKLSRPLNSM